MNEGFWYTNGVAVAPDQSFVAFAETNTMTVHQYWLKGPQVSTSLLRSCKQHIAEATSGSVQWP